MCAIRWLAGHVYMPEKQRPWAGTAPPGAVYRFAPDWKEEHVLSHLVDARGILQADGYKGYAKLYESDPDGVSRLYEAACWAHLRRDFQDFWASTKSEGSVLKSVYLARPMRVSDTVTH